MTDQAVARAPSSPWFAWTPTSGKLLEHYESCILSLLKTPYRLLSVPIHDDMCINTVVLGDETPGKPALVLVHGFGGGLGMWGTGLDAYAAHYTVYAIDTIGFGRSSRPSVAKTDPEGAERLFVQALEEWRKTLGLTDMVLCGHSFGGYQCGVYALQYPQHIKHLVLADPWGFPAQPSGYQPTRFPLWMRTAAALLRPFSPLAILRGFGPLGPRLIPRIRPDFAVRFSTIIGDPTLLYNYIYHLNAQKPSGEVMFAAVSLPYGWARAPLINRVQEIDSRLPITFIYGEKTWMDKTVGRKVQDLRAGSSVSVHQLADSGHHVYAENPVGFAKILEDIAGAC